MKNRIGKILILLLLNIPMIVGAENICLHSPDRRIKVEIGQNADTIRYTVKKDNAVLLNTSPLDIIINSECIGINSNLHIMESNLIHRTFPVMGGKKCCDYKASRYKLGFVNNRTAGVFYLEFDVSNQGVAFRYLYTKEGINNIEAEHTTFRIPAHTKVWFAERKNSWKLKSYAGEFISCDISELDNISPTGPIQCPPLLFEYENGMLGMLSEAALYNYSGMRLQAMGNNVLCSNFTEGESGFDILGNMITPWRIFIIASDLNELVNTDMINGLNPSPDELLFKDKEWIKPGKAFTRFFSKGCGNPKQEMEVIDCAASLNIEYSLIDEGWERWKDKWFHLRKVCAYARKKKVGVWVWKHSEQIKDSSNDYSLMRCFLDSVKQSGACGVKVDFQNSEDKMTIDFDMALLKFAAEHKLLVNIHGCQKPSGESVTFPNELTREGVRGWELNAMPEGPIPASHNAVLPFTRCVVGNADYTPLCYTAPGHTTWAHQLATLICFVSPFLCIPENPDFIVNDQRVSSFNETLSALPTVWDETRVLPMSHIGELAVIARRRGQDWYLGIINAGDEKMIDIPLNFIQFSKCNVTVYSDDFNAEPISLAGLNPNIPVETHKIYTTIPYKVDKQVMKNTETLNLRLAKNGGAFLKFTKK